MIELLTIGTELLLGTTIDTNGAWLGARLAEAGFPLGRRTTVPDDAAAIRDALLTALKRSGTVICTGGLGPTADDLTRPVVASVYRRDLVLHDAWLEVMTGRFRDRGLEMPVVNRTQALVPTGALLLPNSRGTAPGLLLEDPDLGTTILLPGVPSEMRELMREHVLPWLVARYGAPPPVLSRTLRTTGIAESTLQERLADLLDTASAAAGDPHAPRLRDCPVALAFLPTGVGVDLRLTCWGERQGAAADDALAAGERLLMERVGEWVYGHGEDDLGALVGQALRSRNLTLTVAESCTGGLLGQRITSIAGASDYFVGGFIVYANRLKQQLLDVTEVALTEAGAVSEAVAVEMATGAAAVTRADCAISVTGIAGPAGGTPDKPVGTVWIGLAIQGRAFARRYRFGGTREEIRARAAQAALAMMLRELERLS